MRVCFLFLFRTVAAFFTAVILACSAGSCEAGHCPSTVISPRNVGGITPCSTREEVRGIFGAENVEACEISAGEGMTVEGTVVFGGTENELLIEWGKKGTPERLMISGKGTDWETGSGITVGTPLEKVEKINRAPFVFTGFGWDYGGRTLSWQGGCLPPELQLEFGASEPVLRERDQAITGDKRIRSDNPLVKQKKFRVEKIFIRW